MDTNTFYSVFSLLISHGYLIMFFIMFIEGPVATTAAAFAAAQGYFSLLAVFFISLAGDMVADTVYYCMGYSLRLTVIEKFGHFFGLTHSRIERLENLLKKHTIKTIVALKLTPMVPVPGFMIIGSARIPFLKFLAICLYVTLFKTTLFMIIGYYFGIFYRFIKYLQYGNLVFLVVLAVFIGLYFVYKKLFSWLSSRIEKV